MRSMVVVGGCLAVLVAGIAAPAAAQAPVSSAAPSSAPAPATTAVRGQVFGDANANGRADSGEGVAGVKLHLYNNNQQQDYTTTTTVGGRFATGVPRGSYYVDGAGSGWHVLGTSLTVGASDLDLSLRAVHQLGNVLEPTITFAEDSYAPGDQVHLTISVTNTGSERLFGIGAACNRIGDPDELNNVGPEWGPLSVRAAGLTLEPGQTRTVEVTTSLPSGASRAGVVIASCDFGYNGVDDGVRPTASDEASVPGQSGAFAGDVLFYPNGHGGAAVAVAGMRVVLVDLGVCPVLSRTAITDADGHFRLGGLPAGPDYKLYLYPPAGRTVKGANPARAFVFGNDTVRFGFELVRGSATVPDPPTDCSAPTTAPSSGSSSSSGSSGLADTGSTTGGMVMFGLSALVIGLLLTLLTALPRRRRRAH